MELFVPTLVLAALGALALMFGWRSQPRPGHASPGQIPAGATEHHTAPAPARVSSVSAIRIIAAPSSVEPYPVLRAIDAVRGEEIPPFAADPQAARLEARAHELTDAYWSELAWMTGRVPHRSFEAVVAALEPERTVPMDPLTMHIIRATASARMPTP
jgi:hypothetical protein